MPSQQITGTRITFINNTKDCDAETTPAGRKQLQRAGLRATHSRDPSFWRCSLRGFKPDRAPRTGQPQPSWAPSRFSDLRNLKEEALYQASCQTSSVLLFSVLILYGSRCFSKGHFSTETTFSNIREPTSQVKSSSVIKHGC